SVWPGRTARDTGPVSGGSSGDCATAVPTCEIAGHGPAACCASVQAFFAVSRLTPMPGGSVTAALAVLALPAGPVMTVRSDGSEPVLIEPLNCGLNGSLSHAVGLNGAAERVTAVALADVAVTFAVAGPQPVGIVMNGVLPGLPSS